MASRMVGLRGYAQLNITESASKHHIRAGLWRMSGLTPNLSRETKFSGARIVTEKNTLFV